MERWRSYTTFGRGCGRPTWLPPELEQLAEGNCPELSGSMKRAKHVDFNVDPRVERSRQLILRAALQELGEVGYGAFTIESVAARSGVAKSTIYRHWSDKLSLIADAFLTFHEQQGPDIESGKPRDRVERIIRHVAEV